MRYYIGVDIGGTNIAIGVVDENYNIINKTSVKTDAPRSADSIIDEILDACYYLCNNSGVPFSVIEGIGIACPGLIKDGVVISAPNLKFENINLKEKFSKNVKKICGICNDANAAALGEYVKGIGKQYHSLVALTIGTGVGGGMVLDGKIWDGFNGAGAEIGHIVIVPEGRLCGCGSRGCLECYCSATALINDTKEAMLNNKESKLWQICDLLEKVNGKTVFDAAALGDEVSEKLIDRFIKYLGIGLVNIITLIQPEVICIGGGMSTEGDRLIKPLNAAILNNGVIRSLKNKPKIIAASLFNDAGIVGAVANVIGEMKNEKK